MVIADAPGTRLWSARMRELMRSRRACAGPHQRQHSYSTQAWNGHIRTDARESAHVADADAIAPRLRRPQQRQHSYNARAWNELIRTDALRALMRVLMRSRRDHKQRLTALLHYSVLKLHPLERVLSLRQYSLHTILVRTDLPWQPVLGAQCRAARGGG